MTVQHKVRPAIAEPTVAMNELGPIPAEMTEEAKRRQRMRSIALALALGGLVVLFYAATMVRLGGNVMNRAL